MGTIFKTFARKLRNHFDLVKVPSKKALHPNSSSILDIQSQKGMTTLVVLVSMSAMVVSMYLVATWIITLKQQVVKTENMLNIRFAINSTMDFALFTVKQKYCYNGVLLQDAPCDLNHPASIERLIMSDDQENSIKEMIRNGAIKGIVDANNLQLEAIEKTLLLNDLTSLHPLFRVFQDPKLRALISGVWLRLEREQNLFLPRAGREIFMKITVELIDAKGKHPLTMGGKVARMISNMTIYPRELGSFALLVPNDLHLESSWDAPMTAGDVTLHQFAGSSSVKGSPGLTFLSPVFVNNNIHLPSPSGGASGRQTSATVYTPVNFSERVFIGNGMVMENKLPYAPATAGALVDRNWNQNKLFGGFRKGIENDGVLDEGLLVMSGAKAGTKPDTSLMNACISLVQARTDRVFVGKSKVSTVIQSSSVNDVTYRFGLPNGNKFLPQENPLLPIDTAKWGTGTANRITNQVNGAVAEIQVMLGDKSVTAQLPREGSLVVAPEFGSLALKQSLEKNVADQEALIQSTQTVLANLNASIAQLNNDIAMASAELKTAQDAQLALEADQGKVQAELTVAQTDLKNAQDSLAAENAKGTPDLAIVTGLQNTINNLQGTSIPLLNTKIADFLVKINTGKTQVATLSQKLTDLQTQLAGYNKSALETTIADTQVKLAAAKAALQNYLAKYNSPPEITISVSTYVGKSGKPSDSKVLMSVKFKNVSSMMDQNGNPAAPIILFKGYDLTYSNSQLVSPPENKDLQGYLNYSLANNNTELLAPLKLANAPVSGQPLDVAEDVRDFNILEAQCIATRDAQSSQSFGGAAWDVNFAPATRHSWNFAGTDSSLPDQDPVLAEIVFDGTNASKNLKNATFQVRSIVGICRIKSTADFVTGFLTCDQLIIEARNAPLRIIGSIIASSLRIDPSAYISGIVWSSIYYPQATSELRAVGILKSQSGRDCNTLPGPLWHPAPSIQDAADRFSCNTISLRAKADPFQWTSVDPDCGLLANKSATTCKRKLVRFLAVEQSREDFL